MDDLFRASPEFLVRTGSLKNKVIPADTNRSLAASSGPTSPSNYAVYNIQTGCFTWQGRSVTTMSSLHHQFYFLGLIIKTPTWYKEMTGGLGEASWIRITRGWSQSQHQLKIIQNNLNKKIRSRSSNVQIESEDLTRAVKIVHNTKQDIWRMDLLVKTTTSCTKVKIS